MTVAPILQTQSVPLAEVAVSPVGMMSWTVMPLVVGPLPLLVTVMA